MCQCYLFKRKEAEKHNLSLNRNARRKRHHRSETSEHPATYGCTAGHHRTYGWGTCGDVMDTREAAKKCFYGHLINAHHRSKTSEHCSPYGCTAERSATYGYGICGDVMDTREAAKKCYYGHLINAHHRSKTSEHCSPYGCTADRTPC